MALSTNLLDPVEVTTGAATATLAVQPADNCHTIIVYNQDTNNSALFGFVTTGTALSSANAVLVPAASGITLRIGTAKYRPCGGFADVSGIVVRVKNNGVGTPILSFQFLNSTGDTPP